MIIFNYNLIFNDECSLNDAYVNNFLETIYVCELHEYVYEEVVIEDETWDEMSSQLVRYFRLDKENISPTFFSWGIEIKDMLTLIWDTNKRTIFYQKNKNYSSKKLQFWVIHTFLPMVFELQNKYHMLHVGAVEISGVPVLFSAFSFGGKSTLTDYFLKKGHTLLSDDSLAVEEKNNLFYAVPSYPYHRPYREVETLGNYTENFATESKPIHVVYTLKKADGKSDIVITELKGIEKFKALHKSIFIDFDFMKKKHFEFLTKMAEDIPIYEINVPWDLKRLEEVYEVICTHTNNLK